METGGRGVNDVDELFEVAKARAFCDARFGDHVQEFIALNAVACRVDAGRPKNSAQIRVVNRKLLAFDLASPSAEDGIHVVVSRSNGKGVAVKKRRQTGPGSVSVVVQIMYIEAAPSLVKRAGCPITAPGGSRRGDAKPRRGPRTR